MKITSPSFKDNMMIPARYTCDGENINPPLEIFDVPEEAKSLVLIVDDPDAPGGRWVHWTIWNINPDQAQISENNVPDGAIEGKTDSGKPGYSGPCPPGGIHHYFFKLYAVDKVLELNSEATVDDLNQTMENHILDKAQIVGLYSRKE